MNNIGKKYCFLFLFSFIILSSFFSENRYIKNIKLGNKSTEYILKKSKQFDDYIINNVLYELKIYPQNNSYKDTSMMFSILFICSSLEEYKKTTLKSIEVNNVKTDLNNLELSLDEQNISFDNIFSNGFEFYEKRKELQTICIPNKLKKITVKLTIKDDTNKKHEIFYEFKVLRRSFISMLFDYL